MGLTAVLLFQQTGILQQPIQEQTAIFSVSCFGAAETREAVISGLCDTLEATLSERMPGQQNLSPGTGVQIQAVVLQVTRTEDHFWQALLTWKTDQPESMTGPAVELTGMDKTLGPGDYRQFIQGLLKASNFSF